MNAVSKQCFWRFKLSDGSKDSLTKDVPNSTKTEESDPTSAIGPKKEKFLWISSIFIFRKKHLFFPSLKSEIILDLWKNWKWHFNDKVSKKSCSLCSPLAKFWFTDTRVSYSRTKSRRNISMTFTIVKYSLNCLLKRSFGEMVTKAHPWQKM